MNSSSRLKSGAMTAALVLLAVGSCLTADVNSNVGTSAFSFLKINIGARPVAMGGAYTGLSNDENALYYNPSGIAKLEQPKLLLEYHNYIADLQSGTVGYIKPLGYERSIGFYINYLNYGDFTETDENGNTLGEFSGGDFLFAASFASSYGYYLSFGGTVKFIYESIQDYSATGVALDLGAKYTGNRDRWSAGLMIQNLGTQLSSLGEEKDRLPLTIRGGGAITPRGLPLTIASDLIIPIDNDPIIALGAEYTELKPVYLRLGWNSFGSNYRTTDSEDSWAGIALGVGFEVKKMQISYAFTPAADLGDTHRITLTGWPK